MEQLHYILFITLIFVVISILFFIKYRHFKTLYNKLNESFTSNCDDIRQQCQQTIITQQQIIDNKYQQQVKKLYENQFKYIKDNILDFINDKELREKLFVVFKKDLRQEQINNGLYEFKEKFKNKFNVNDLIDMYNTFGSIVINDLIDDLKYKSHPAPKAAETVRKYKNQFLHYRKNFLIMQNHYYEVLKLFPKLEDYVDNINEIKELLQESNNDYFDDQVKTKWLTSEEYANLSEADRNQLALDRWIKSPKTKLQIGYEFEMYVGYWFRRHGYEVKQFGIERGFNDLGIDIIASKINPNTGKRVVYIVQCKYWRADRVIHENIINQLFGTTMAYYIRHKNENVDIKPVLVCSHEIKDKTTLEFAKILHVQIKTLLLQDFPRIKCNINEGNKIYHLPFDQQYYNTKIEKKGEFYAFTVSEAEKHGFRRAQRFIGSF